MDAREDWSGERPLIVGHPGLDPGSKGMTKPGSTGDVTLDSGFRRNDLYPKTLTQDVGRRTFKRILISMQDTTREVREVQTAVYRRMGGERRVMIALDLSETVRELARARIRRDHPDFDERQVEDELLWELYGFRRVR